ncbi:SpoIID/LytB domain-containing protein [Nocardioides jiangxiensis]|uniref:SpoIID/LytB domain-containing protein n=1 Tax=Nocardioides jiangxiensis TaxID=3064524 RepID=A0ABT9B2K4_9ACTN|nr:SpoIID/LytB domain-containing protein [Nocardioides sp. WY-20]MDO7867511.1 SpoIID/LytB domain-containing protein [Nocardioides sp. WY-20]
MRRGALGLTTALLSSVLVGTGLDAAPASAATTTAYTLPSTGTVTLAGHGYGHGHGMSQYGAQGAALAGQTWQQITSFYYPGTSRSTLARTIRVKISADTSRDVVVGPRSGLGVLLPTGEVRALPSNGAERWRLEVASGNRASVDYLIQGTWTRWTTFDGDGAFTAGGQPIRLYYAGTSHRFRGNLAAVRPSATSTDRDTINVLSLEDYLKGVVPSEMPASWDPDAVAAQAVAARTYAAYQLQTPQGSTYDICDTTSCQVYGGNDAEWAASNAAIAATKGVILTSGGKPAFTQFSSSSGGFTSAGSFSYLPAKDDPYDAWKRSDGSFGNPNHSWSATVDVADIEKKTGIANVAKVSVLMNDDHHVSKLTFTGTGGKVVTVYGDTFRSWFGLRSTYFAITGRPTTTP